MAEGLLATRIGRLRVISVLEATSFLILLTCSVLKRTNEWELGVQVMGPVHGILFVTYVLGVLDLRRRMGWGSRSADFNVDLLEGESTGPGHRSFTGRLEFNWTRAKDPTLGLIVAAVLPIAPFFVEHWLRTQTEPVRA